MKRVLLLSAACLCIFLMLAIFYLLHTQSGLNLVFSFVQSSMPELSARSVQGSLSGPLIIRDMEYSGDGFHLTLKELSLDWRPSQLLFLKAHLTSLNGKDIRIETEAEREEEDSEITLPEITVPLQLIIDDASILRISISQADGEKPVEIEKVQLSGLMQSRTIDIQHLTIQTQYVEVKTRGSISPQGDYPLELFFDWDARPEGYSPVKMKTVMKGTIQEMSMDHQVTSPVRARLGILVHDLLSGMQWEGSLHLEESDLGKLKSGWPGMRIWGAIEASGDDGSSFITGSAGLYEEMIGKVLFTLDLKIDKEMAAIMSLIASREGTAAEALLSGNYLFREKEFDVCTKWTSVEWPLSGGRLIRSPEGKLCLKGSGQEYQYSVETSVAGDKIPKNQIRLAGKGTDEESRIETLEAHLLQGVVRGNAGIRWKGGIEWEVSLQGSGLNPGAEWADWPGRLGLEITADGEERDGEHRVSLSNGSVRGELRGYQVKADTAFDMNEGLFSLQRFKAVSGASSVTLSGAYSDTLDAGWNVIIPDLKEVYPGGEGEIHGEGTIQGSVELPRVSARLRGHGIAVDQYRAEGISVDIQVDAAQNRTSTVDITAKELLVGDHRIESIILRGDGTLSSHAFQFGAASEGDMISLSGDGAYLEKQWMGRFKSGEISSGMIGAWKLQEPLKFTVSKEGAETNNFCWLQETGSFCMSAAWSRDRLVSGNIQASNMPLSLLGGLMPEEISMNGSFDAEADGAYDYQSWTGQASLAVEKGSVSYQNDENEEIQLAVGKTWARAGLDNSGLTMGLDAAFFERGSLAGELSLPGFDPFSSDPGKQPVSGLFTAELSALDIVPFFTRGFKDTKGVFLAEIRMSGDVSKPLFAGHASLSAGEADIPGLGIKLSDIGMKVEGSDTGALLFTGEITSGEGKLLLNGTGSMDSEEMPTADIIIKGENFEAVRIPGERVIISPDMQVRILGPRIMIDGSVAIPEASLEPTDLSGAVEISDDVVIIDDSQKIEKKERYQVSGTLKLKLGDKIVFSGFGLSGGLTGMIDVTEQPGKTTQGRGEIHIIDGKYRAYGQELVIEKGRLIFLGIIDNPGLDIRATRQIREVVSGVQVGGTIQSPRLSVFSVPSMDESDALSYLIFGRPMNRLSGSEGNLLYGAALSAGLSGGGLISKKIAARFGIEDVEIETGSEPRDAALFLGKYLSPRLYVSYGIGLFEPVNTLRLRYQLSPKWLLQTEYGTESGGDLLYKLER